MKDDQREPIPPLLVDAAAFLLMLALALAAVFAIVYLPTAWIWPGS